MPRPVRLIVCVNERLGAGQRSCVGSGNLNLIGNIQNMIHVEGLDVAIVRRECLGRCEQGPVMRIAPAGPFFTEIDEARLSHIIDALKLFIDANNATES